MTAAGFRVVPVANPTWVDDACHRPAGTVAHPWWCRRCDARGVGVGPAVDGATRRERAADAREYAAAAALEHIEAEHPEGS